MKERNWERNLVNDAITWCGLMDDAVMAQIRSGKSHQWFIVLVLSYYWASSRTAGICVGYMGDYRVWLYQHVVNFLVWEDWSDRSKEIIVALITSKSKIVIIITKYPTKCYICKSRKILRLVPGIPIRRLFSRIWVQNSPVGSTLASHMLYFPCIKIWAFCSEVPTITIEKYVVPRVQSSEARLLEINPFLLKWKETGEKGTLMYGPPVVLLECGHGSCIRVCMAALSSKKK